jgi:hypothetical protein
LARIESISWGADSAVAVYRLPQPPKLPNWLNFPGLQLKPYMKMYDLEHCILYPAVKDGDNLLSETGDERHIGTLGPILWDKNGEKHVALTAGHSLQPCQTEVFIRKSFEPDDAVEVFAVSRGSVRVPIDRPTGLQDITEEEHYSRPFVRIREPANFMDDYYALLVPSTVIVDTISRNTNF